MVVKTKKVHQLLAQSFLNHKPEGMKLVPNHKNFIRTDNRKLNLEIVTQRENTNLKHLLTMSEFVGVCWNKKLNKWVSRILIDGKRKYLGLFISEIEASNAYKIELNKLKQL